LQMSCSSEPIDNFPHQVALLKRTAESEAIEAGRVQEEIAEYMYGLILAFSGSAGWTMVAKA